MELSTFHLEKLTELLRVPEPEVLQGNDLPATNYEITATSRHNKPSANLDTTRTPKTIEEFEQQEAEEAENMGKIGFGAGERKTPAYTMNYQQSVSAEDVFLQIGPKTPSSASCENLIVKVKMPGDKKENVDLSVEISSVTINSSQYYLKLSLPHEIDPDNSKANWNTAEETLLLTLKLNREFDFGERCNENPEILTSLNCEGHCSGGFAGLRQQIQQSSVRELIKSELMENIYIFWKLLMDLQDRKFPLEFQGQSIKPIGKNWIINYSNCLMLDAIKWKKLVLRCSNPEYLRFVKL